MSHRGMFRPASTFRVPFRALGLAFRLAVGLSLLPLSACDDGPRSVQVEPVPDSLPPVCAGEARDGAPSEAPDGGAESDAAIVQEPGTSAGAPSGPDAAGEIDAAPLAERPRVVLISIDGLRPDAIVKAPAKNLLALACKGAYSWQAQTISPSITLPSHASMVSGYSPSEHKLLHNDLRPGYIPVPTVLGHAKAAGLRSVLVVGKEKLLQLAPPGSFDVFVWASAGDDDVADKAIAEAVNGFDMMFVHFGNVDITGHGNQWMSEPYVRQVVATDAAVGRLLEVLPPGTTVIVTADHGGHGYNHAEGTLVDSTIPWIVSGPRIRRGHAIAQPISTVDSAATAAHVLGLQLRGDAVGRFVQEAFAH